MSQRANELAAAARGGPELPTLPTSANTAHMMGGHEPGPARATRRVRRPAHAASGGVVAPSAPHESPEPKA